MNLAAVRRAHEATNTLHQFIYFTPEFHENLVATGLEAGRMPYFAGRAAPMGAVSAGVVAATFYGFNPSLVRESIPRAWALADPASVAEARFAAADAALTRLLGAEPLRSADVARLADLTREAVGGCEVNGRPMYAGQADLEWPTEPHMVAWHAISMLREHRGDGHVAALLASGLNGLESLITHVATGQGFVPSFAKVSRGWSDEEWDLAVAGLVHRGVLDRAGDLTTEGHQLRQAVEADTDQMAASPWRHLGDERTEEVIRIGAALTVAVRQAGAIPTTGVYAAN
jgi:hypothetical protein